MRVQRMTDDAKYTYAFLSTERMLMRTELSTVQILHEGSKRSVPHDRRIPTLSCQNSPSGVGSAFKDVRALLGLLSFNAGVWIPLSRGKADPDPTRKRFNGLQTICRL